MGIRASLSFRYIAPTTRTAQSSILTPKIAKIPFAETCPFHKLELYEIGELPVLPPSSVTTPPGAFLQPR